MQRLAELERKIGQLTVENDFLKKALGRFRDITPSRRQWRGCLFEEVRQAAEGRTVKALCQMTGLSRAGYYRWRAAAALPVEMEMRDQMQKIALEFPAYGYRRITAELNRRGFAVNHKRVLRLMRQDNLLCLRRSHSGHHRFSAHLPVYPNLAGSSRRRQSISCGSPISPTSVCASSSCTWRWCWSLLAACDGLGAGPQLEAELAVSALRMALRRTTAGPGLVHHSDRGIQYASLAIMRRHCRLQSSPHQHESQRESLRQGLRFILHLLRTVHECSLGNADVWRV